MEGRHQSPSGRASSIQHGKRNSSASVTPIPASEGGGVDKSRSSSDHHKASSSAAAAARRRNNSVSDGADSLSRSASDSSVSNNPIKTPPAGASSVPANGVNAQG